MDIPISVTKTIAVMMRHAIEGGATSIHIEPDRHYTRIRFRVGSTLQTALVVPSAYHDQMMSRLKLMSRLFLDEEPVPQHGMGVVYLDGQECLFSIATMPVGKSEKAVIHLPTEADVGLAGLGIRPYNVDRIQEGLQKTSGLVVFAGPIGSGKTTTGYACVQERQKAGYGTATIEYPIKRFLPGVAQVALHPRAGLEASVVARAMARKPHQTVYASHTGPEGMPELARLGLSGKYVMANMTANDAFSGLKALSSSNASHLAIANLQMLVAQRFVPRLCPHCKAQRSPSVEEANWIRRHLAEAPKAASKGNSDVWRVGQAVGCKKCYFTGYRGKVLLTEVISITPTLRQYASLNGLDRQTYQTELSRQGALTLTQDAAIALSQFETTPEMIWRNLPTSLL